MLSNIKKKLEKFTAKVGIEGVRKYDHVTPIMKELEWQTMKEQFIFGKCTTMNVSQWTVSLLVSKISNSERKVSVEQGR